MAVVQFQPAGYRVVGAGTRYEGDWAAYVRPDDGGDFDAITVAVLSYYAAGASPSHLAVTVDAQGDETYQDPVDAKDPALVYVRPFDVVYPDAYRNVPLPPVFIPRRGSRVGVHTDSGDDLSTDMAVVAITFWRKVEL